MARITFLNLRSPNEPVGEMAVAPTPDGAQVSVTTVRGERTLALPAPRASLLARDVLWLAQSRGWATSEREALAMEALLTSMETCALVPRQSRLSEAQSAWALAANPAFAVHPGFEEPPLLLRLEPNALPVLVTHLGETSSLVPDGGSEGLSELLRDLSPLAPLLLEGTALPSTGKFYPHDVLVREGRSLRHLSYRHRLHHLDLVLSVFPTPALDRTVADHLLCSLIRPAGTVPRALAEQRASGRVVSSSLPSGASRLVVRRLDLPWGSGAEQEVIEAGLTFNCTLQVAHADSDGLVQLCAVDEDGVPIPVASLPQKASNARPGERVVVRYRSFGVEKPDHRLAMEFVDAEIVGMAAAGAPVSEKDSLAWAAGLKTKVDAAQALAPPGPARDFREFLLQVDQEQVLRQKLVRLLGL